MELIVPKNTVVADLTKALEQIGTGPMLLHVDMLNIGMLDGLKNRSKMCEEYENVLEELLANREFILPTFNYDFCKNGIYDVHNSPSQVGALTDHYRKKYWHQRTRTPVFNFCVRNKKNFTLEAVENCFGEHSIFAQLVKSDGIVAFLGADFSSTTFIHHVEELSDVTYRFHKVFDGTIVDGDKRTHAKLIYRVRPLEPPDAVVYDWPRLQVELEAKGLLHTYEVGNGVLRYYRAAAVGAFWITKVFQNPTYLLKHT
ncbi:MAG: AAC(3) family N-acetyltransferase [Chlamydiales bacterium]|nr:AAC(3) family N-acetyltransferase [Chlamydiales bacterium]